MRNIMFVLLFIATGTTNMNAIGADWKFCGGATLFEGEQTIAFYDSESVDQTSSGTIKVWVKCLNESKFEEVMKNNNCLGPPDHSLRLIVDDCGNFLLALEMVICVGCIYSN